MQIGYTLDTIDKKQPSKAAAKDKAIYYFYQATVLEQYDEWPESHKRQRKWFTYSQAMEQLSSRPELQEALKKSTINQWSQEHTGTLGHQMQEERDIHDGRQGEDTAPLKSNGGDGDEFASVGSNTQGDQVLALTEKFSQSSHKTESVAEPGPQVKSQHDDDMGQITSIVVALSSPGVEPVTDVSSDSDLGKKSTTRQGFQDRAAEPVSPPALSRSLTLPFMPQESLKAYSSKEIGIGSQDAAQSPDGSSSSLPSSDDTMRDSDTTSKEELKATVLNRLMRHFYEMISSQQGQKEATEGSDGSSHGVQPSHLTNSTTDSVGRSYFSNRAASSSEQQGAGGRLRNTQRKRPAGDDDGANDGEDDQAGRAPKQPRASEPQDRLYPHLAKHLACPYFKNDPMREHPARSCLGPGWVYVPRIKSVLLIAM